MFTGIVDHCGVITAIVSSSQAVRLSISHSFSNLVLGESICIDGVCLTVTHFNEHHMDCDVSPETLQKTIAAHYRVGSRVNVERAMRLSDRLGGHIVTGHVDTTLRIQKFEKQHAFIIGEFSDIAEPHQLLLTNKGSVCINGVSLTINDVHAHYFSVMLIPHTLAQTNLSALKTGDFVNVEYDYLAKLIQKNVTVYRGDYVEK